MSSDPTLEAAMKYVAKRRNVRRSIWRRVWNWYKRVTGYEQATHDRLWRDYLAAEKGERR